MYIFLNLKNEKLINFFFFSLQLKLIVENPEKPVAADVEYCPESEEDLKD